MRAGARPVGTAALDLLRIAAGIPRYGIDIRERDLPQETEQERALNFSKGCYVGQEIVERIRSRGQVRRKFTGFEVNGPLPAPGSKVLVEGKDVGEITSAASLPLSGRRAPGGTGLHPPRSSDARQASGGGWERRQRGEPAVRGGLQVIRRKEFMAEKKQESFTVTDRRLFTSDGELRQEVSEEEVSTVKARSSRSRRGDACPDRTYASGFSLPWMRPCRRLQPQRSKKNRPMLTANRPKTWMPGSNSAAIPPKKWR